MTKYSTYQTFARRFADRLADRIVGIDQSLERIVNLRPADQVLGGFLTPLREAEDTDDEGSLEDLPQDSAYEQTSMGLEWITPLDALCETLLQIQLHLSDSDILKFHQVG